LLNLVFNTTYGPNATTGEEFQRRIEGFEGDHCSRLIPFDSAGRGRNDEKGA